MRVLPVLAALGIAGALAGCDVVTAPNGPRPDPIVSLPRALTSAEQDVIEASNGFAFDLLRDVVERETAPNVFLSPLSASMALGMTMNGARGETLDGMREALGFGSLEPDAINDSYRSLIDLLVDLDRDVEMRIANSIWLRQGFPLEPAFVESSQRFFDARVTELDFAAPGAPRVINRWVEENTAGRIEDIVDRIDSDVMLYLINASYFKASWTTRFDPQRTQEAEFRRADGSRQTVNMMSRSEAKVRHAWTPEAQIVDIPYGREAFSMTLVLPQNDRSLDELVASLDSETWNAWLAGLNEGEIGLHIPRFRLEYEKVLNQTLRAMGMETAFTPYQADFTGMSPRGRDLYIGNVKQKTFVEVDEEGTEAAAATSVEIRMVSAPPEFRADRPFLVAIRERLSGTILFLGVIGAPPSP